MVLALCKLHNFCIDRNEADVPSPSALDDCCISLIGGIDVEFLGTESTECIPSSLLDGGFYCNDVPGRDFRAMQKMLQKDKIPRDFMFEQVIKNQCERPPPNKWNNK